MKDETPKSERTHTRMNDRPIERSIERPTDRPNGRTNVTNECTKAGIKKQRNGRRSEGMNELNSELTSFINGGPNYYSFIRMQISLPSLVNMSKNNRISTKKNEARKAYLHLHKIIIIMPAIYERGLYSTKIKSQEYYKITESFLVRSPASPGE